MERDEVREVFERMAPGYDRQWARMAPIRDNLQFLLEAVFAGLPDDARMLCVGAGTGAEVAHLAARFPRWRFTVVEPARAMLDACRQRAAADGFEARCQFHEGYLETLAPLAPHDGATCLLVSQFILDRDSRIGLFRAIAERLVAGGVLASSDLAADVDAASYPALLGLWLEVMASGGLQPEAIEQMRAAYARDVAVMAPDAVAAIIAAGGFAPPLRFFQAGLMHAWRAVRT